MGHCKDCKYFLPYNDYEFRQGANDSLGFCEKADKIYQYKDVQKFKQDNLVIASAQYGYDADVMVGINFGCIHFEPKDK